MGVENMKMDKTAFRGRHAKGYCNVKLGGLRELWNCYIRALNLNWTKIAPNLFQGEKSAPFQDGAQCGAEKVERVCSTSVSLGLLKHYSV